jgi:excisionase family DNA binding protein
VNPRRNPSLKRQDAYGVGEPSSQPLSLNLPAELLAAMADAMAELIANQLEGRLDSVRSPWMTTLEAIHYTRLPEGTFRKLAASGAIPSHGGRAKLFHRAEVDQALGYVSETRR